MSNHDSTETASFWATEAFRHVLTAGGAAVGLFGILGVLIFNYNAHCDVYYLSVCTAHSMNVLGSHFTTAGQLGLAMAVVTLILAVLYLFVTGLRYDLAQQKPEA